MSLPNAYDEVISMANIVKKTFNEEKSNDQHLRALVVYAKAADSKLYYESTFKTQVSQEDVAHWFGMGSLVVDLGSNVLASPVTVSANTVTTVTYAGSTPTVKAWTAKTAV